MMLRFYICDYIDVGTPPAIQFEPASTAHIPLHRNLFSIAGRSDFTVTGKVMVGIDVVDTEHVALNADPLIRYIPFEDAGGVPLGLSDPISQVSAANRALISNALESRGVPADDFTGSTRMAEVIRRIAERFLLRQVLRGDDFGNLDETWASLPAARKQAIKDRLQAIGVDTFGAAGSARDVIREVLSRPNKFLAFQR